MSGSSRGSCQEEAKEKKGKSDVICGRGIGRPRNAVQPDDRPYLIWLLGCGVHILAILLQGDNHDTGSNSGEPTGTV